MLLILLGTCQPAIAEPVLHCDSSGCAWVEEVDPAPGVSLYEEQRSTRSIPAELWMPTTRGADRTTRQAPLVLNVQQTVERNHHRHGDPMWKQACRARGVYPSACLPSAYGRRQAPAALPAPWPVGLSQAGQGRER